MPEPGRTDVPAARPDPWPRRAVIALVVIVLLVLGYVFATSFLPRWWAQRIAGQAHKEFRWGVWWGLVYGFLCTLVPIEVARQAVYRQIRWRGKVAILVVALLLAMPNLMTLGIVLGSGNAAHAGRRILDVDAPGFRGATLAGVIVALVVAAVLEIALHVRRRHRGELQRLRIEQRIRDVRDEP
jgi:hypothetical protein